jgi:hypothetical protein
MAESSCYHMSFHRNSVCRLMYDIDLHPLLGAHEVSGHLMVAGYYCTHVAVIKIILNILHSECMSNFLRAEIEFRCLQ